MRLPGGGGGGAGGGYRYLETDAKKRPLSVRSTSSTASSVSSGTQQRRKKMATDDVPASDEYRVDVREELPIVVETSAAGEVVDFRRRTGDASKRERGEPLLRSSMGVFSRPGTVDSVGRSADEEARQIDGMTKNDASSPTTDLLGLDADFADGCDLEMECCANASGPDLCSSVLSGSSYINRVVLEILDTERTYVQDLQDIIQVGLFKKFYI